ncbi:uncharacterized protein BROUX77_004920 [Berkeleyomyces rouxiae]|uniref:uncharacterized protein n=1 Tax=Berkeleyomyces rouxiae TaxID=2035830 RepID=UPI003B78860B
MEVLGAATTVITIIELTAKLGSLCLDYGRAVKNSAAEIGQLQEEIEFLKDIAERVHDLFKKPEGQELAKSKSLDQVLKQSDTKLQALVLKLQPKSTKKWRIPFTRELQWPFQREEVKGFIRDIQRYNETISQILQVYQT